MLKTLSFSAVLAVGTLGANLAFSEVAQAQNAIRTNTGFTTNTLPRNDDGFTGQVPVGFTFDFFGVNQDFVYVNNNGNVTFTSGLGTFTPDLDTLNRRIIAPFFADVDTRNPDSSEVTYGMSSVDGRPAFGVNWDSQGVGYFPSEADKLNKFQLVMIDRSDTGAGNFDFEFNYEQIQWETGSASGGTNGFGGSSALVGYSNGGAGTGNVTFELPGSLIPGSFLDGGPRALIETRINSDVFGRLLFNVRNGVVQPPQPEDTTTPEPSAVLAFVALGLAGLGAKAKRQSK